MSSAPIPPGPETFRAAMAPTVRVIRDLTDAINAVSPRHHELPSAESRAMKELAAEAGYADKSDWKGPIRDTHTFGGVTLRAATDFARSFGELFDATVTPMYGHLVLARSALEVSVVSKWLNDPDVAFDVRVKRGMTEQVYNAQELTRLKLDPADAKQREDYWEAVANAYNWLLRRVNNKPTVDGEGRPGVPDGINRLLLKEGEWGLGRVQWSYLSAVSHGTWYGLRQAIIEPPADTVFGLSLVGFGTESHSVLAQAVCVMGSVRNAATARFSLMGWMDEEWKAAAKASIAHEELLIKGRGATS